MNIQINGTVYKPTQIFKAMEAITEATRRVAKLETASADIWYVRAQYGDLELYSCGHTPWSALCSIVEQLPPNQPDLDARLVQPERKEQ